ncbi:MAG: recombination protein RecR [Flavobacteriaceae bacterium]|jgi:recombination protein RecR|nr:recombination protein RecR [Flavobacteriaceae bacterium]|tara:strand:+ start:57 stop:668 length:612 start_codon:yes stop_codon:yes gene_type:complete
MDFPSKILENTVNEISKLPGIGKRTALRLALHILKQPENHIDALADSIKNLRKKINFCSECYNLSDNEICEICLNPNRQNGELCVVEDIRDVMAIENTSQFKGRYHVLNGLISPIDGVGPADLKIDSLIEKIRGGKIKEVIFALSATMEGDTTIFYINKNLSSFEIKISTIARGIPVGDELEYTDEITLGRSILKRIPYTDSV